MISETCSVCGAGFDVVFRYQMEERGGGFAFYCSQKCLEKSQKGGDAGAVNCDACMKSFTPDLVSQILYLGGKRRYACSLDCRSQLQREAQGARLGDLAQDAKSPARSAPAAAPAPELPSLTAPSARPAMAPPPMTARSAPGSLPPPVSQSPRSAPPQSQSQSPRSVPPQSQSQSPAAQSVRPSSRGTGRLRREEAPTASSRTSGLHTAIRPETDLPAEAVAGTVIPVTPPFKGEKKAPELRNVAPRRIAVFNHKGGTGKTTTAVSVAAGLAAKGKRVLLVDTDAQGNVSVSLGAGSERSLYHVLVMGLRVTDAVKEVRPGLHLLPSNETLAAAELYLAGRQNRDRVLADRLSQAAADYDYVVLDCSPSLSLMNQNALVFADSVLVPVACDYLSLVGVRQVLKTVKNVNALLHHPVQIWGVLPTFFDGRAKICNEAVATLKDHFGDKCLPPIRAAIKVKEAPSVGQTIFEYAQGSNAAEDYGVIVDRIVLEADAEAEPPAPRPRPPTSWPQGPRHGIELVPPPQFRPCPDIESRTGTLPRAPPRKGSVARAPGAIVYKQPEAFDLLNKDEVEGVLSGAFYQPPESPRPPREAPRAQA
ncbi:MAG: AAA family ATPase [Polyangiaceae bacterium]